jgi:hypothetical protein
MSPTVILEGETAAVAELRRKPFQIILDGGPAGSIARNQTVELPVEPGLHTLQVRDGRYSSHTRSFDVADDRRPLPLQRSDPLAPIRRVTLRAHDRPQTQTRIG